MGKRVLLIDMYGVIIKESKGNFIPYTLAHFPEAEHGRLLKALREDQLFTRAGNGEMGSEEFLTRLGYADPDKAMRDYLENWLTLDPGFKPFAKRLSRKEAATSVQRGESFCLGNRADESAECRETGTQDREVYDFVLLSNDVAQWNAYLMELHGLKGYFMDAIVSGQVHMRKPGEDIFRYTLERLDCAAQDCVFVDNSAANLRTAEKLGIQTVHFNRDGEDYEGCQVRDFRELAQMLEMGAPGTGENMGGMQCRRK